MLDEGAELREIGDHIGFYFNKGYPSNSESDKAYALDMLFRAMQS